MLVVLCMCLYVSSYVGFELDIVLLQDEALNGFCGNWTGLWLFGCYAGRLGSVEACALSVDRFFGKACFVSFSSSLNCLLNCVGF